MNAVSDTRKQIWKFQEGAVVLALREYCGEAKVHWDYTPDGMSIDPDVVVGDTPDLPDAVVFVTHASAERAGEKKFWRTVAEVVDAKRLGSRPRVVSVLFASNVKANLLIAYESLFDGVVHLDDCSWGSAFSDHLTQLAQRHGSRGKETCVVVLASQIDQEAVPGWRAFAGSLKAALSSARGAYDQRIASSSFKRNRRIPAARDTTLRRSLCKYYTFPVALRRSLASGIRIETPPEHAVVLEWVTRSLGGYRLTDPELNRFLATADSAVLETVPRHIDAKLPAFKEYTRSLRNTAGRQAAYEWVVDNHGAISTPAGMQAALQSVHLDPVGPLEGRVSPDLAPADHWLFSSVVTLLRTETGRKDGYGYSSLADHRLADSQTIGNMRIGTWCGCFMNQYVNRKKGFVAPPEAVKYCGVVLSEQLLRLGQKRTKALAEQALKTHASSTFNYQLATYRHYNPVDWLVCDRLETAGHPFEFPARHPSFLSAAGHGTTTSTGNIISVDGGRCWIKCQSAYAGKVDKRKELCGRIGAMKLCYTPEELDQKKFYLVVDGFFDDRDLTLLDQAGWDGIFYWDELDALLEAIGLG